MKKVSVFQIGSTVSGRFRQVWLQVAAAHACYILAGQLASPFDPAAKLCLPGVDHCKSPRRLADVHAIHRGMLLDWAQQKGD